MTILDRLRWSAMASNNNKDNQIGHHDRAESYTRDTNEKEWIHKKEDLPKPPQPNSK